MTKFIIANFFLILWCSIKKKSKCSTQYHNKLKYIYLQLIWALKIRNDNEKSTLGYEHFDSGC